MRRWNWCPLRWGHHRRGIKEIAGRFNVKLWGEVRVDRRSASLREAVGVSLGGGYRMTQAGWGVDAGWWRSGMLRRSFSDLRVANDLFDDFLLLLPALGMLPPARSLVLTLHSKVLASSTNWSRLVALLAAQPAGEAAGARSLVHFGGLAVLGLGSALLGGRGARRGLDRRLNLGSHGPSGDCGIRIRRWGQSNDCGQSVAVVYSAGVTRNNPTGGLGALSWTISDEGIPQLRGCKG